MFELVGAKILLLRNWTLLSTWGKGCLYGLPPHENRFQACIYTGQPQPLNEVKYNNKEKMNNSQLQITF
jgi:hypothetical protein